MGGLEVLYIMWVLKLNLLRPLSVSATVATCTSGWSRYVYSSITGTGSAGVSSTVVLILVRMRDGT